MEDNKSRNEKNNKRILKNTIVLYFRMILIMVVTLFTARIVLNALGVQDFGIYSVVGGVVLFISFLNSAMAISTQRFLNFEMGRENLVQLKRVFSMSVNIHLIIGIIILLSLETFGIWFVENQLTIPENRLQAAITVYHFSAFSLFISIITVPYYADIIANEKMNIFAYIGIGEVLLKLGVAYLLIILDYDKLKLYGILLFIVTCLVQFSYYIYSRIKFPESKYSFFWDKQLFLKIISFASWTLIGSFATVMKNQGSNILLNIFFGPVVNAAKSVSAQAEGALSSFVSNFQLAMKPQIVKSYASKDISYLLNLIFSGAKYSYFLLLLISLPILLETPQILKIWLKLVPEYAVIFVRLAICGILIDTLSVTLMHSIQATGKIRLYQIVISSLFLSIIPISYLLFHMGYSPESLFVTTIAILVLILFFRVIIVKRQIPFSIHDYFRNVVLKAILVTILSLILPLIIIFNYDESISRLILIFLTSIGSTLVIILLIGINNIEKAKLFETLKHLKKIK
ncbi:MAG: lipopolysaccharide biosynthesis protein [Flavobacteriaceae bacterium]|nr:lipopolysaccharide biosynthesis protein [Flavobacteriaceae bacterium]